jgi:hypothetical protein
MQRHHVNQPLPHGIFLSTLLTRCLRTPYQCQSQGHQSLRLAQARSGRPMSMGVSTRTMLNTCKKAREEQAKFGKVFRNTPPAVGSSKPAKLVEISPEKKAVSKNANLLIDLDLDLGQAPPPMNGQQSYATSSRSKGKAVAKANMSLLD